MHDFEPGWDTYIERPAINSPADLDFTEVRVEDYAAVLLPGGRAPEYLRNDGRVLAIIREFRERGKWIFAICHGVQVLASAGLVTGAGSRRTSIVASMSKRAGGNTSQISRRCGMERWSPGRPGNPIPSSIGK